MLTPPDGDDDTVPLEAALLRQGRGIWSFAVARSGQQAEQNEGGQAPVVCNGLCCGSTQQMKPFHTRL